MQKGCDGNVPLHMVRSKARQLSPPNDTEHPTCLLLEISMYW